MKFNDLCSIAHNIADSFGSGASLLFRDGGWPYDDPSRTAEGVAEVDFLNGILVSGTGSPRFRAIISEAPEVVGTLCSRHGASADVFAVLIAKYITTQSSRTFEVTVQDQSGRRRTDHYSWLNGQRIIAGKHPPASSK